VKEHDKTMNSLLEQFIRKMGDKCQSLDWIVSSSFYYDSQNETWGKKHEKDLKLRKLVMWIQPWKSLDSKASAFSIVSWPHGQGL
jgi:hypothetical protein